MPYNKRVIFEVVKCGDGGGDGVITISVPLEDARPALLAAARQQRR